MAQFVPDEQAFGQLREKVVVLTGGSTGIGAATTTRLVNLGAHVVFGDINASAAETLVKSFDSSHAAHGTATFVPCDVRNYADIYTLFKTAHDLYGHVDHAFSCAGIFENGNWFDPDLTIESVGDAGAGPSVVIDVNLMGSANFARVAVVFLRHTKKEAGERDCSLTFMSSVNAFRESPGLYMYQTSKHAVQGLMRSMRKTMYERDGIRVNCVCPGVTESEMTKGIVDAFRDNNLYWQPSDAVAKIVLGVQVKRDMNGKAVYVEGGDGWEFEDGFYRELPRWLGEEPTRRMKINAEAVNKGALLKK